MNFKLFLNEKEVQKELISSINIKADITDLFIRGKIIINNLASMVFNDVKTGMDVNLSMSYDDNKTSVIKMKLLKFNKIPGNKNLIKDTLEIDTISSYFFKSPSEVAFYEKNISGIIKDIIDKNYKEFFNEVKIFDTDDTAKIRYRIGENTIPFLNKCLFYGRKNGLPVYLYPDFNGNINLKGIYDMVSSRKDYTLVAPVSESSTKGNTILLNGFRFISNLEESTSIMKTVFANDIYVPYNVKMGDETVLTSTEVDNPQSQIKTPAQKNYSPWYVIPEDSYSLAIRDNFEKSMYTYTAVGVVKSILVKELDVGTLVNVKIPCDTSISNGKKVNLGEGDYIIKSTELSITGKDQSTRVEMIQANY